jgi:hypothetical protein
MMNLFLLAATAFAADGVIVAVKTAADFELTADPSAPHWKSVTPEIASLDRFGKPVPGHRTEIRTRWTPRHLYILYTCPYRALYGKPNPSTTTETDKLWEWDVAEVFIGSDFQNIHKYKEFQVSPQGEWVDLDIDRKNPLPEGGWKWNSGFQVKARVDGARRVWYGEMKIPISSIDSKPAAPGRRLRINFYRIQGPDPRVHLNWRVVNANSYHTPAAFGLLEYGK